MKVKVLTSFRSIENFDIAYEQGKEYDFDDKRAKDLESKGLVEIIKEKKAESKKAKAKEVTE